MCCIWAAQKVKKRIPIYCNKNTGRGATKKNQRHPLHIGAPIHYSFRSGVSKRQFPLPQKTVWHTFYTTEKPPNCPSGFISYFTVDFLYQLIHRRAGCHFRREQRLTVFTATLFFLAVTAFLPISQLSNFNSLVFISVALQNII